ncbi:MAG: phosphatase PAP2 family protein [Actinomycetota bacterium]|nr:phosphatase PAP2 family protein [Actinomycetota bacterium]
MPGLVAAVAFSVPVTVLALVVRGKVSGLAELDQRAITAATTVTRDHPGLLDALKAWETALQPVNVYVVATAVCLLVWWRGGLRARAVWAFLTMMVAWNIALDLKYVVQRVRPVVDDPVSSAPGFSFPSGHVANAAAACTALTILLWPLLRSAAARAAVAGVLGAVVVLTVLDRVYLGVHFPSDTVAGVLVGSGLVVSSFLGFRGYQGLRGSRRPLGRGRPHHHHETEHES